MMSYEYRATSIDFCKISSQKTLKVSMTFCHWRQEAQGQEPAQEPEQPEAGQVVETETDAEWRGFTQAQKQQMTECFAEHPCFGDFADQDFKNRTRKDISHRIQQRIERKW